MATTPYAFLVGFVARNLMNDRCAVRSNSHTKKPTSDMQTNFWSSTAAAATAAAAAEFLQVVWSIPST